MGSPNPEYGTGLFRYIDYRWILWAVAGLALFGVAITLLFFFIARNVEQERILRRFDDRAEHQIYALQSISAPNRTLLNSLRSFVQSGAAGDQQSFNAFAASLLADHTGVQALEWVPCVPHEQRTTFEAQTAARSHAGFRITELDSLGNLVPAAPRAEYYPVTWVMPLTGNRQAVGFDLGSEPDRLAALLRSLETDRHVASAPVTLVQERGSQKAYLVFLPVRAGGGYGSGRGEVRGFVLGVFRMGDVVAQVQDLLAEDALGMIIRDLDVPGPDGLVFGDPGIIEQGTLLRRRSQVTMAGRRWQVDLVSRAPGEQAGLLVPLVILFSGLLLTGTSCALLLVLARSHGRIEALVRDRTRALQVSQEKLRTVADLSSDFVFWRRPDRKLEYVSPAAQSMTGYRVREFLEQPDLLDRIIHPDDRRMWQQHWEDIQAGRSCRAPELRLLSRDGTVKWVRHRCRPVHDDLGNLEGVRAHFSDISEARRHAEQLARERLLFTGGPVVVFRWRAEAGWPVDYVSPNVDAMFGVEAEEFVVEGLPFIDFVHPEDRPRVQQEVQDHVRAGAVHFEQDYRIIDRQGNVLHLYDMTYVVWGADGRPTHFEGYVLDVTEREEARAKLEVSRQRLNLALEGASLGLWDWNVQTDEVFFDQRWARMLGYDHRELNPNLETWAGLVHPDDKPEVIRILQDHLEGRTAQYASEHRLRHRDGHWIWVLDRGRVLLHDSDGTPLRAVGTHLDITERREREDREVAVMLLREKVTRDLGRETGPGDLLRAGWTFTRRYAELTGAPGAFLVRLGASRTGIRVVHQWNPAGDDDLDAVFRELAEAEGEAWWQMSDRVDGVLVAPVDDLPRSGDLREFFRSQGVQSLVLLAISVGPDHRYCAGFSSLAGLDRWQSLDLETFASIRESFVHLQQRLVFRQQNESTRILLVKALDRAEQANKVKTNFLARMSHEIRTPLTAIAGLTDILGRQGAGLGPREQGWLRQIRYNSDHLVALLNDLLDLSKIDAGELKISREPVAIGPTLSSVEATLQPRAREKGVDLVVACSPRVPDSFVADRLRLHQILLNLAGNAVKFTDTGRVEVEVDVREVEGDGPDLLVVTVCDTGVGIAADQQELIFQPFLQAAGQDLATRGGTGLGLDISRRLARAMGGDITVVSRVGLGSAFTLSLPLDRQVARAGTETDAGTAGSDERGELDAAAILAGKRILIVDDNPDNRQVVSYYLEEAGMVFETAENGSLGVDRVRSAALAGQPFDLVLMDMRMPVMNGYDATMKLRKTGQKVPIIALTAHATDGDEQACLNFGCNGYVSKPIEPDTLLMTMARLLAGKEGSSERRDRPAIKNRMPRDPRFAPLVARYQASLVDVRQELAAARDDGDAEALTGIAHRLHGTGANFGFPEVSEAARDCEDLLRDGLEPAEVSALDDLDRVLREATADLEPVTSDPELT